MIRRLSTGSILRRMALNWHFPILWTSFGYVTSTSSALASLSKSHFISNHFNPEPPQMWIAMLLQYYQTICDEIRIVTLTFYINSFVSIRYLIIPLGLKVTIWHWNLHPMKQLGHHSCFCDVFMYYEPQLICLAFIVVLKPRVFSNIIIMVYSTGDKDINQVRLWRYFTIISHRHTIEKVSQTPLKTSPWLSGVCWARFKYAISHFLKWQRTVLFTARVRFRRE